MKLSALDIRHAEFERGAMGYRTRQVREFLERIADEAGATLGEIKALREALAERDAQIEALRASEAELKRAVIAAERIGNDVKAQAEREAALIVRAAKQERLDVLQDVASKLDAARAELGKLDLAQALVREQLRGQLTAFLSALDSKPMRVPPSQSYEAASEDVIEALKETVEAARRELEPQSSSDDESSETGASRTPASATG